MKIQKIKVRALGILTAATLAVVLVAGCAKKENPVVGRWDDGHKGVVTMKADNTFEVGTPPNNAGGKWTSSEKTVTINIETIGGKPVDDKIKEAVAQLSKLDPKSTPKDIEKMLRSGLTVKLTISEDGKTMSAEATDGRPATKFTKLEGDAKGSDSASAPTPGATTK